MITLRPATASDRDILFMWRQEYDPVTEAEHNAWLAKWIETMSLCSYEGLFIAEIDGVAIGTGRITMVITGGRSPAAVHYYIVPSLRQNGHGTELVKRLTEKAKWMGYREVVARIKRENRASLHCALMGGVTAVTFL